MITSDFDWIDDGHSVRIFIEDDNFVSRAQCPHGDTDRSAVPYEDLPACRRVDYHMADDGAVQQRERLNDCMVVVESREFTGEEFWWDEAPHFEVTELPVRIVWAMQDEGIYAMPRSVWPAKGAPE